MGKKSKKHFGPQTGWKYSSSGNDAAAAAEVQPKRTTTTISCVHIEE
jgi:hypothetical protein